MIMSLTNVLLLVLLLIMLPVLLINELIFDPFSGPIIHYHSLVILEYKRKIVRKVEIFCTAAHSIIHPQKTSHHYNSQIFFLLLSVCTFLEFCSILFTDFNLKFVIEALGY